MELSVASRIAAGYVVVEVGGEIDVYTAPKLRDSLNETTGSGHSHIVVDFSRVDFIDSTGLGVLVGVNRRLKAGNGVLRIVCPNDKLMKIFRISGLESVLDLYPSVATAVAETSSGD
jgi:anti-sigma B factor antagonist